MRTTTTTREYDAEGRMVKETVTETETPDAPSMAVCTCNSWYATYCPRHGYRRVYGPTITCAPPVTYTVNADTQRFADAMVTTARAGLRVTSPRGSTQ